jgi:hypothetical protein
MNCSRNCLVALYFLVIAGISTSLALAFVSDGPLADIEGQNAQISFILNTTETEYEEDQSELTIERKMININIAKGLDEKISIYGSFGYMLEGEPDSDHSELVESADLDKG